MKKLLEIKIKDYIEINIETKVIEYRNELANDLRLLRDINSDIARLFLIKRRQTKKYRNFQKEIMFFRSKLLKLFGSYTFLKNEIIAENFFKLNLLEKDGTSGMNPKKINIPNSFKRDGIVWYIYNCNDFFPYSLNDKRLINILESSNSSKKWILKRIDFDNQEFVGTINHRVYSETFRITTKDIFSQIIIQSLK